MTECVVPSAGSRFTGLEQQEDLGVEVRMPSGSLQVALSSERLIEGSLRLTHCPGSPGSQITSYSQGKAALRRNHSCRNSWGNLSSGSSARIGLKVPPSLRQM